MRFLFFIFLFLIGCSDKGLNQLSSEVRSQYKDLLKPLERVDFLNTIGFEPNEKQVNLGRFLFNDTILSRNNDVSCATCHLTSHGFADGQRLSFGALGKGGTTGASVHDAHKDKTFAEERSCGDDGFGFFCKAPMHRNTPSTINVAYRAHRNKDRGLMWDGRFGKLFHTSLLPIMTQEELCGSNPILPGENNLFAPGKGYFKEPVVVYFATPEDQFSGKDVDGFYSRSKKVKGIASFRENGTLSVPTRNECLAIAVAKIRSVQKYRKLFKQAFKDGKVSDRNIGKALAAFVSTHVSKNTKYDQFVKGQNTFSKEELLGLAIFFSPPGKKVKLLSHEVTGAGCVECHKPPLFGSSNEFFSLGVKSDPRSRKSVAGFIFSKGSLFNRSNSRGLEAQCHIKGKTASEKSGYGPDVGLALISGKQKDCFRFRVPDLRNIIQTFPYFHHGLGVAQGVEATSIKDRAEVALKAAIDYHILGPRNVEQINFMLGSKRYHDSSHLLDPFVPVELQTFTKSKSSSFPIDLGAQEKHWLYMFIAEGLRDERATSIGELGNDVSHPSQVPSGLYPSISRDSGRQNERLGDIID